MKKLLCLIITIFTVVGSLPCIAAETDDPFYMGISNLAYTDANGNQLVKGNISSAKMSVRLAPSAATEKANVYTVLVQKNSEGIIKDIKIDSSEITGGTYKDVSVTLENITVAEGDYLQTFI